MKQFNPFYEVLVLSEGEGEDQRISSRLSPAGEARLTAVLKPHQLHPVRFLYHITSSIYRENIKPWCIVVFKKEYHLAGHIYSKRRDQKNPLFTSYTLLRDWGGDIEKKPPDCSALFYYTKGAAKEMSRRSPLFQSCWPTMQFLPEGRVWLIFPPSLNEDWVKETEKGDAALFYAHYVPVKEPLSVGEEG